MSTTGGVGKERGYTILIILLVVSIGFAAVDFVLLNLKNGEDRQAIALTTQIQVLSQQTAKYALEASSVTPIRSLSWRTRATPSIRPCSAWSTAIPRPA